MGRRIVVALLAVIVALVVFDRVLYSQGPPPDLFRNNGDFTGDVVIHGTLTVEGTSTHEVGIRVSDGTEQDIDAITFDFGAANDDHNPAYRFVDSANTLEQYTGFLPNASVTQEIYDFGSLSLTNPCVFSQTGFECTRGNFAGDIACTAAGCYFQMGDGNEIRFGIASDCDVSRDASGNLEMDCTMGGGVIEHLSDIVQDGAVEIDGGLPERLFGYNDATAGFSTDRYLQVTDNFQMNASDGLPLLYDGSVVAISIYIQNTSVLTAEDVEFEVYINGSEVFQLARVFSSSETDVVAVATQARGIDTFTSEDRLMMRVNFVGTGTMSMFRVLMVTHVLYDD